MISQRNIKKLYKNFRSGTKPETRKKIVRGNLTMSLMSDDPFIFSIDKPYITYIRFGLVLYSPNNGKVDEQKSSFIDRAKILRDQKICKKQ